MQVDIRPIASHLASLIGVALRSFMETLFVMTLAGVVLAGLSYYFLREDHLLFGVLAVAVALFEAVTLGFFLGIKRAVVMAVAHGLGKLRLGRSVVSLVVERMLGIAAAEEFGERGGRLARGLERLPLAQADELLSGAVRDITGEAASCGWLNRKIQARFLEVIRNYTLARFREEGAKHGGVDLLKMKEELEQTVDDALVRKVQSGLRLWTCLAIIGLPIVVAAQTLMIVILLQANR